MISLACALSRKTLMIASLSTGIFDGLKNAAYLRRRASVNPFVRSAAAIAPHAAPRATAQTDDTPSTTVAQPPPGQAGDTDPFLWLEQVHGDRATAWVKTENDKTLAVLEKDSHYQGLYNDALAIAQAKDRIAYPTMIGGKVYNFWQD